VFALAEVLVENQIGISKSSNSSRLVPETIISIFAAYKKLQFLSTVYFTLMTVQNDVCVLEDEANF
jgi:hypothetical protein